MDIAQPRWDLNYYVSLNSRWEATDPPCVDYHDMPICWNTGIIRSADKSLDGSCHFSNDLILLDMGEVHYHLLCIM